MSAEALLLLRRGASFWGVARDQVRGLDASGGAVRVNLTTTSLWADEVLGLPPDLEVRPAGPLLRRFWQQRCRGVAVHGGVPLVVVDTEHPPRALLE